MCKYPHITWASLVALRHCWLFLTCAGSCGAPEHKMSPQHQVLSLPPWPLCSSSTSLPCKDIWVPCHPARASKLVGSQPLLNAPLPCTPSAETRQRCCYWMEVPPGDAPNLPLKQQQRPVCVAPCLGRSACHICTTSLPDIPFHVAKFREQDLAALIWGDGTAWGTPSGPVTAEPLLDLV